MKRILVAAIFLVLGGCTEPPEEAGRAPGAAEPEEGRPPRQATLVKMLSWAEEESQGSCRVDLEGSEPPARFDLRYMEAGRGKVTIESEVETLAREGWGFISRSARGYGFEKSSTFTALDFDIVEELRCECGPEDEPERENHIIRIGLDWQPGELPVVEGTIDGEASEPVEISGHLGIWEFRFVRPMPAGGEGTCASRFLAAVMFDEPLP